MQSWDTSTLEAPPSKPKIVSSAGARVIVLHRTVGKRLQEHEVRARAAEHAERRGA